MPQTPLIIDVLKQAGDWPDLDPKPAIHAVRSVMDAPREGELSIVLTNNTHIQALNRDYRNKDAATNVLSFPQEGALLGDVILALETLQSEAADKGIPLADHFAHLIIHGVLHLYGYDHENDGDAAQMESLEIKALSALNIDNPYKIQDEV